MGAPRVVDADGVRTVTLDRPEVLNALTLDDLEVIRAAASDLDGVRALVLTSSGDRAFSSGMHLRTFLDAAPDQGRAVIDRVGACVGAIRVAPVPTVIAVRGYCLGAAFELALACDLRIADPTARFGLPEVLLGIPSVVDAVLLLHHVGLSKAKEMTLTGDSYGIDDLPPGLVNRVVATADLERVTAEAVRGLVALTPEVFAAQKALFESWLNTGLQQGIDMSRGVFGEVFAAPATQQAIADYAARRRG